MNILTSTTIYSKDELESFKLAVDYLYEKNLIEQQVERFCFHLKTDKSMFLSDHLTEEIFNTLVKLSSTKPSWLEWEYACTLRKKHKQINRPLTDEEMYAWKTKYEKK